MKISQILQDEKEKFEEIMNECGFEDGDYLKLKSFLHSSNLRVLEAFTGEIEKLPRHLVERHVTEPTIIGAVTLEDIKELIQELIKENEKEI